MKLYFQQVTHYLNRPNLAYPPGKIFISLQQRRTKICKVSQMQGILPTLLSGTKKNHSNLYLIHATAI
jgi:hypothetical protein